MKKYTFKIYYIDKKTKRVESVGTMKTKALTLEQLRAVIRDEIRPDKNIDKVWELNVRGFSL